MNNVIRYTAYRNDSGEDGEVLFIDFENNLIGIRFFAYTNNNKYFYDKTYDINDKNIILTQCK